MAFVRIRPQLRYRRRRRWFQSPTFTCTICNIKFDSYREYREHKMEVHFKPKPPMKYWTYLYGMLPYRFPDEPIHPVGGLTRGEVQTKMIQTVKRVYAKYGIQIREKEGVFQFVHAPSGEKIPMIPTPTEVHTPSAKGEDEAAQEYVTPEREAAEALGVTEKEDQQAIGVTQKEDVLADIKEESPTIVQPFIMIGKEALAPLALVGVLLALALKEKRKS